ncbi:CoA transferase [Mycobacterium branderi]|uniref:CoA transferase n=1 Tax=Mycobacterium branderi TaxID=43348 RepID=A0A7I7WF55_9MYCO|nr:CoA transferase [Mycobacterium branderi]MCV7231847.1 CoA transferase [Mycobacterium branderi]ORA40207.1 hypothetical protein BST20_06465 [Mycobacterium branderi]BBZ15497.1 hypothetical protein MBRA_56920 [Mycobacterium branderi]
MTSSRSVELLRSLGPVVVLGTGQAAVTAAQILRVLGAQVATGPDLNAAQAGLSRAADAVICDVVAEGASSRYIDEVAERSSGVWVTVSAFGLDGPRGGLPGSDLLCAAAGGLLSTVSDQNGHYYPMPGRQALKVAGQMAALALLHAMSLRLEGAPSVHLDVSAQEAVAFCSIQQEVAHRLYECRGPAGASRYATPSGVFRCTDGEIGIIVLDDHQWRRASEVLGQPTWPAEYPTVIDRLANRDVINAAVSQWTCERSKFDCEELLQSGGVAAVALRTLEDVRTSDQFRLRDFIRDDADALRTATLPGLVTHGTPRQRRTNERNALSALRVVEASNVLAGPLAGAILGAMGAQVVRLEEQQRLDIYRRNGPFKHGVPGQERAAYFLMANYCKRSVYRGIGGDQGRAEQICRWADVLLENLGARRLQQLGVRSTQMFADAGKSSVSISGFGRTGPCADYKAYAPNVHAFGGLAKTVQEKCQAEVTVRTSFADYCVAVWGATVAAAWWLGADHGCAFDLSMAEVVAAKLDGIGLSGVDADTPDGCAELLVRCPDGSQVAVATAHTLPFGVVADALGIDADNVVVSQAAGAVVVDMSAAADGPTGQEILDNAAGSGIAMTALPVLTPEQVLDDSQLTQRGFVVELDHPEVEKAFIFALPWKEAGRPRTGYRRAPLLAEDDEWMDEMLKRSGDFVGTSNA